MLLLSWTLFAILAGTVKREMVRVQRKEDSVEATEDGVLFSDEIKGKGSFHDLLTIVLCKENACVHKYAQENEIPYRVQV